MAEAVVRASPLTPRAMMPNAMLRLQTLAASNTRPLSFPKINACRVSLSPLLAGTTEQLLNPHPNVSPLFAAPQETVDREDQKNVATHFLRNSPPGQFAAVLQDVQVLCAPTPLDDAFGKFFSRAQEGTMRGGESSGLGDGRVCAVLSL